MAYTDTAAYYIDLAKRKKALSGGDETEPVKRDLDEYLKESYRKAASAKVSALEAARDAALSSLANEERKIEPRYYESRNAAQASSDLALRRLNETAAANGLSSGAAYQARISSANALQGRLGTLAKQQQQEYADIASQRAALKQQYATQIASAKAQGEGELANALYQEYVRQDDAMRAASFRKVWR